MLADQLQAAWPPEAWRSCHVLVAVSGGADSVALLRSLAEVAQRTPGDGRLLVAHFNHRTRGQASDEDAAWVARLGEKLGLEVNVGRAEHAASLASEDQARRARYEFLQATAEQLGARYVATAHTADDQAETVLLRILRGSGIEGLAGMPFARPLGPAVTLVRPLLEVTRAEVEEYLGQLGQAHRHDTTNDQSRFTRNWVRREVLPMLRSHLPQDPAESLLRLAGQAAQWREAIDAIAGELAERAARVERAGSTLAIHLDASKLANQPTILVQQVARTLWRSAGWAEQAMGMGEWQRIASAVADPNASTFQLPGGIMVGRQGVDVTLTGPVR
ncbi:tRNA lysidine(34) synthetase TilS [Aeoliella sp. SH292]|uniref:tRNA lysidine(34) synthetase TilS n=1 Tax=Aeoliella sp. SH292 TaxID=3454464 RepID=UPI003F994654